MAAEFMSDEEIDSMLSSVNTESENDNSRGSKEQSVNVGAVVYSEKVFKCKKPPLRKFTNDYKSPVIKRKDILYDPAPQQISAANRVVVHTVEPYKLKTG